MLKKLKNKNGLTLIELIAVLVILGIIAAIAVPTIGNTINAQRKRAADLQWSNIMSSAELYLFQNTEDGDTFSMDDIDMSAPVVLEEDSTGTIIASDELIFENSSDELIIVASVTVIYIDGFLVYGTE